MKRYIYIVVLSLLVVSCEKTTGEIPPHLQYVFCNLEDESNMSSDHVVHVSRDGGEFVLQVAYLDDTKTSYFDGYSLHAGEYYEDDGEVEHLNLDNYSCQWFELSRIGNHKFKVKFHPVDDKYDKIEILLGLTANIGANGYCVAIGYHVFEIY